ncbi:MAG: hypothetical protein Q9162_007200 [Coniocarpon cinnabarinum]
MATKIATLAIRTLAKPLGNSIKSAARNNPTFKSLCISWAQWLHRTDMRMRLGLLSDPTTIDRQVAREQAELNQTRNPLQSHVATAKTLSETQAEQREAEEIRKRLKGTKRRIKPLSESKAIDTGATFASEFFLFAVAAGLIFGEQAWSRARERGRKEGVEMRLVRLEEDVRGLRDENERLRAVNEGGEPKELENAVGEEVRRTSGRKASEEGDESKEENQSDKSDSEKSKKTIVTKDDNPIEKGRNSTSTKEDAKPEKEAGKSNRLLERQ